MWGTIVVAGSLAQPAGRGGHTWCLLQYLLGLRRLGWEALLVDRLEPNMYTAGTDGAWNLRYLQESLAGFGLENNFSVLGQGGASLAGLPRSAVLEKVRRSAFLLNIMGFLTDEEVLAAAPRRVFLDIDPGFGQMWYSLGLHDLFAEHDAFVTVGTNIGRPECPIPTCGREWITTRPPVVLEHWPQQPVLPELPSFTSVATWRGPFAPVVYQGKTYGLRAHELRKFLSLPRRTGRRFELALDIHPAEVRDLAELHKQGWELVDPLAAAGSPGAYQEYIRRSGAELLIAKNMYVEAQSGWFSDRSVCYLASGRPVLAQDTGLDRVCPTGEGLLPFTTLEEAVDNVDRAWCNYPFHAQAARSLAEAYFDSDKVLSRLLVALGVA
jgi:hypothetical protein